MTRHFTLSLATILLATTLLLPADASARTTSTRTIAEACGLTAVTPQEADSCTEATIKAAGAAAGCTLALGAASAPGAGWALVGVAYSVCLTAMYAIEDAAEACGVTGTGSDTALPDELQDARDEVLDALEQLGVIILL